MSKQKLSAKEVMKDLRAGMSNAEIMEKYKISEKGLESLFNKLSGAGVLTQAEIVARSGGPSVEPTPEPIGPDSTPKKPAREKVDPSVAKAIMDDIKAGMHDNEIMFRHELSPGQYRKIVDKLIEKGHLPKESVDAREPKNTVTCPHCSAEVPEESYKCPECGQWIESFDQGPAATQTPPAGAVPRQPIMESTSFDDDKECPWDERENYGTFNAYFQTATKILLTPTSFFSQLPVNQGYLNPILFSIMSVALPVAIGFLILSIIQGNLAIGLFGMIYRFFCVFIGAAIVMPLVIFIWSGMIHLILIFAQGANSGFEATTRVVSYSSATSWFTSIPYIGPVASSLYGLVLTVIGLRETHETSTGKAAAAVAIPFGLVIIVGVAFSLMAASMVKQMFVPGMTSAPGVSKEYKGEVLPDEVCTALDEYFASIDSARGLDKESAMNAISDAWEDLNRVCAAHSKHPNYVELKQTLAQHLIAIQLQAAFGKQMASHASKGELALRDRLMRMCGK